MGVLRGIYHNIDRGHIESTVGIDQPYRQVPGFVRENWPGHRTSSCFIDYLSQSRFVAAMLVHCHSLEHCNQQKEMQSPDSLSLPYTAFLVVYNGLQTATRGQVRFRVRS